MQWEGRPVIGAIGRLAHQKGLPTLLQATAEIVRDFPGAILVLAGDGPERERLEEETRTLGIQDAVCFLGVYQDIPALLASIDILAMPSLSEGMPMALLEAMAASKAVVASPVGAIPRLIQDQVNGILVPPGESKKLAGAFRGLFGSRELRSFLGSNARQTIESHFSAASMAKQYADVYRDVACGKGRVVDVVGI
jgi:glycosyltransferase involved in cell wall biosynthesis